MYPIKMTLEKSFYTYIIFVEVCSKVKNQLSRNHWKRKVTSESYIECVSCCCPYWTRKRRRLWNYVQSVLWTFPPHASRRPIVHSQAYASEGSDKDKDILHELLTTRFRHTESESMRHTDISASVYVRTILSANDSRHLPWPNLSALDFEYWVTESMRNPEYSIPERAFHRGIVSSIQHMTVPWLGSH